MQKHDAPPLVSRTVHDDMSPTGQRDGSGCMMLSPKTYKQKSHDTGEADTKLLRVHTVDKNLLKHPLADNGDGRREIARSLHR